MVGTLKPSVKVVVWSEVEPGTPLTKPRNLVHLSVNGLRFTTQVNTKELAIALVLRLGSELGLE